jgi:hypothetical protein
MQPAVIAGWRALVKINNQTVGAGFVLDYTIETLVTEVNCIDNVYTDELAPERIKVSLVMQVYRTPDNDPVSLDFSPGGEIGTGTKGKDGSTSGEGPQGNFTTAPYITVEVRDKITDKTILYVPKAMLTRRSGRMEAEQVLIETWNVQGIGYLGPGSQISGLFPVIKNIFS